MRNPELTAWFVGKPGTAPGDPGLVVVRGNHPTPNAQRRRPTPRRPVVEAAFGVAPAKFDVRCFRRLVAFWATAFLLLHSLAAAPSFTAQLEPDSIAAGETAVLKLVFTDLGDVAAPPLPTLADCASQYLGPESRQAVSFGTGAGFTRTSTLAHTYALQPQKAGVVEIPAITVEVGGKKYTSNPLKLRVGQGFDQRQLGFIKIEVPKTDLYVGETIPVEIRFYFRKAPRQQGTPRLKMDGFVKGGEYADNLNPEPVEGEIHGVYRHVVALTAVKAGELTLGPAELETIYLFQRQGRRSLFDDPFFGGGAEQRKLVFQSDPVTVKVSPPPRVNQPAGFAGAVGRFSLDVKASPTNVSVGDPITVRTRVRGRGNFEALKLAELSPDSGFQAYPGTNSFTPADQLGLEGEKVFEQVLVPERAGVQSLRLPALVAWNPEARRYDTLEPHSFQVNVRPSLTAQAAPAGNLPPATPAETGAAPRAGSQPMLPLRTQLGSLSALSPPLVARPWFLGLLLAPPLAYAGLGLVRRIRERRETRGPDLRQQQERSVAETLGSLAGLARSERPAEFFAALNQVLQLQLALTLGGAAGAFTEDVVEGRLAARALADEDAARLRSLFGALTQARYSPEASAARLDSLAEDARRVVAALRELEVGK